MEEKAHFNYEGNVKISADKLSGENPPAYPTFARVLQIYNLQPVAVLWEDANEEKHTTHFYLDFVNEVVYDCCLQTIDINTYPLGFAVVEILKEKKYAAQKPALSEEFLKSVMGNKDQILESRPNAGKHQL
jgi:hypothetical protein